ncbi:MAG: prepilin-type N-terminal cleavage/methylation domain-containing protein [Zoogloea sp.]|nr:prepilin-type N-terminal cleavage/methylation domain-containing protein [Zoogloea sp.]
MPPSGSALRRSPPSIAASSPIVGRIQGLIPAAVIIAEGKNAMKNASGFTLLELMITVLIAAILGSLAMPSFQLMLANTRISSAAGDFSADLALARAEAMRRGVTVNVCGSSNATACNAGWTSGWIVIDGNNALIRTHPALDTGYTVTASGNATIFAFRTSGYPDAARTWTLCRNGIGATGRTVTVSAAGRTSLANFVCP